MGLNYVRQEIVHLHSEFSKQRTVSPLQTQESKAINLCAAGVAHCQT